MSCSKSFVNGDFQIALRLVPPIVFWAALLGLVFAKVGLLFFGLLALCGIAWLSILVMNLIDNTEPVSSKWTMVWKDANWAFVLLAIWAGVQCGLHFRQSLIACLIFVAFFGMTAALYVWSALRPVYVSRRGCHY